jgi:hypothetical protein
MERRKEICTESIKGHNLKAQLTVGFTRKVPKATSLVFHLRRVFA